MASLSLIPGCKFVDMSGPLPLPSAPPLSPFEPAHDDADTSSTSAPSFCPHAWHAAWHPTCNIDTVPQPPVPTSTVPPWPEVWIQDLVNPGSFRSVPVPKSMMRTSAMPASSTFERDRVYAEEPRLSNRMTQRIQWLERRIYRGEAQMERFSRQLDQVLLILNLQASSNQTQLQ